MAAAPGIVTSGVGPPNAAVEIQPGMVVQPVVLVDQNGQYVTTSGSTATAGYLADLTGSVNVSQAAAPTTGQVLTATSGTTATWQSGSAETAGYLATQTTSVYVAGSPAPVANEVLTATSGTTATWQFAPGGSASTAGYLATLGTSVFVAGGSAPSAGQELIATSGSAATWQSGANAVLTTRGDMLYENATPALARLAIGSVNTVLQSNGTLPSWQPGMSLLVTTGVNGYSLINGTGTVITWTAPNDGNLHRVQVISSKGVTSTETGGIINVAWTTPNAESQTTQMYAGAQAAGAHYDTAPNIICVGPNTSVIITQGSNLSGGTSVLYAEIWGS